jgi:hypothetical protein
MEEWTKMRPCLFWEMGKKLQRDVCIHCAETLKNFYFIAKEYPVFGGGVDIKIKWSGPKSIGVKFHVKQMDGSFKDRIDYMDQPRNAYVVVSYGDTTYVISARKIPPYISFKSSSMQKEIYADNSFQAWSMIKERLLNPAKCDEDEVEG